MSNQEHTQIFRGDDMPPEIGIAETGGPAQRRRPAAPSDQRSLHDNRDELADLRQLHDASGTAELRKMDDADGGPADSRHAHDAQGGVDAQHAQGADGPSDQRSMNDAEGLVDTNHAHDGAGPSEQRSMNDAQGLVDAILANDAQGPSDQRSISDAEGLVDTRHAQDAEGPSLQRQMQDASHAPAAAPKRQAHSFHDDEEPEPAANAGMVTLNSAGEVVDPDSAETPPAAEAQAPDSDADLTFKVEEAATPWALSIHLEARIASLTESTAKVNEQLGGLEDSIKRLAKRIGK